MSSQQRAAVVVDWIARLPGKIAQAWSPLKERARKNPGFLAAAGAGTLGLLLALGLLVNVGLNWLNGPADESPDSTFAQDDSSSQLGEDTGLDDDVSPYADSFAAMRAESKRQQEAARQELDEDPILGRREADDIAEAPHKQHLLDDSDSLGFADEEFQPARGEGLDRARRFTRDDDPEMADDEAGGGHPLAENDSRRRPQAALPIDLDEGPGFDASEESEAGKGETPDTISSDPPKRLKSGGPALFGNSIDEDQDTDSTEPEKIGGDRDLPQSQLGRIIDNKTGGTGRPQRPAYGATGSIAADDDADGNSKRHPLAAEEDEADDMNEPAKPAAKVESAVSNHKPNNKKKRTAIVVDEAGNDESVAPSTAPSAAGWKRQPGRASEASAPSVSRRESRPVETVIYAESEPDAAAGTRDLNPGKAAAPPTKAAPQLRIEVVGPKSMGAGQSYNVEIRVTNLGRAPAQKLALEVGLPDGLEHEVARNLAQKVGDLPPGGMHRALLRLKAQKTGKAIVRIDLERDAEVVATSSATIDIAEKAVASERILLLDCCCPPPPCCGY